VGDREFSQGKDWFPQGWKDGTGGTMKTIKLVMLAGVALTSGFFGQPAEGSMLTGNLTFAGGATFDTASLATTTRIDSFAHMTVTTSGGSFGNFANPGDEVMMTEPWIFSASTPTLGFWSADGFTFDLATSMVVSQDSMSIEASGTGIVSGNGFTKTSGMWDFVWQRNSSEGVFSFTSNYNPVGVPEGGTTIMQFGLGLAGLAIARRKFVRA
jgi:hypothetical protein